MARWSRLGAVASAGFIALAALGASPVAAGETEDGIEDTWSPTTVDDRAGRFIVDGINGSEQSLSIEQVAELIEDPRFGNANHANGANRTAAMTTPGIHIQYMEGNGRIPADVKALVDWSAAQWNDVLQPQGPVVIEFYWGDVGEGILGAAGIFSYRQSAELGTDAYVPAAIINHHSGQDEFPSLAEAGMLINSRLYNGVRDRWCTAIDAGACPYGTYDMVDTVLHEFAHALGMSSSARLGEDGPEFASPPDLYDTHLLYDTQVANDPGYGQLLDFEGPEEAIETLPLFMHVHPNRNGQPGRLYNPRTFEPGSSLSHWDENTYQDHLMTPTGSASDRPQHSIPADMVGRMQVIGWGELVDGRTTAEGSGGCSAVAANGVAGSGGGEYAELVQTDPAAARIWRLYGVMFRRQPDAGGFEFWRNEYANGRPIEDITEFFSQAAEVEELYGSDLRVLDFVSTLYRNALGRCEDAGGHGYWADRLYRGENSRGEVLNNFSESSEFADITGVTLTDYGSGRIGD